MTQTWRQRRGFRSARAIRREFKSRIDRFKLADTDLVRQTLLEDAEVAAAVRRHAQEIGETEGGAWGRVRDYVREIVPAFNLVSYYRLGYGLARVLITRSLALWQYAQA